MTSGGHRSVVTGVCVLWRCLSEQLCCKTYSVAVCRLARRKPSLDNASHVCVHGGLLAGGWRLSQSVCRMSTGNCRRIILDSVSKNVCPWWRFWRYLWGCGAFHGSLSAGEFGSLSATSTGLSTGDFHSCVCRLSGIVCSMVCWTKWRQESRRRTKGAQE